MKTLLTWLTAAALLGAATSFVPAARAANTVQFNAADDEVNEVAAGPNVISAGMLYVRLN